MVRDAHVRRSITGVVSPVVGASWDFEPGAKDDAAKEAADWQRFCWLECLPWAAMQKRLLTGTLRDGHHIEEVTDKIQPFSSSRFPRHPNAKQGLGLIPTGIHERPSNTIEHWHQQKRFPERLFSAEQWIQGSDREEAGYRPILSNRLIRSAWEQEGADFTGFAPLRSAYGPWKIKRLLMVVEAMAHEKHHMGLATVTLPEDADPSDDEEAKLGKILSEIRANEKGYLILRGGYEFEWKSVNGLTTNINQTIERCNHDIAHNLGTGFMLLGTRSASGSYSLASTHEGQYNISLELYARFIENIFNVGLDGFSLIQRFHDANYGPGVARPRLVARHMPTVDYTKIFPQAVNLANSGGLTWDDGTEQFARGVMRFPEHDPATARETRAPGAKVHEPGQDGRSNRSHEE